MKHLFTLFAIVLLLQSFQCEEDKPSTLSPENLNQKKAAIETYIATFPCEESLGCSFLAFGSKPCGGPWSYLVFSNAVDLEFLTAEVLEYNEMENQFNLETGAVSDCAVVLPPTAVGCMDGICGVIN